MNYERDENMSIDFRAAVRGKGVVRGRRAAALAAAVAALGPAVRPAAAVDYVYDPSGAGTAPAANGVWDVPTNWQPNGVPGGSDTATFSIDASATAPGTTVSLNNAPQAVNGITFSHAAGTYQINGGGAGGVLNVGGLGLTKSGAGIAEITAQVAAASGSTWTVSGGALRLTNVGTTTAQNTLAGVTINLTNTATLQGNAAAGSSSLNGALLDVTGVAGPTYSAPTIRLTSNQTTTVAGVNVHGGATFQPDNDHRLAGPVNVDAGSQVRFGGANAFRPLGTVTLNGAATLDVSAGWTFLNGPQNWGNNTVTKTGGGELQLAGFQGAAPAALDAAHVVSGQINVNAGALITGANATVNSLGTATVNAGGGNLRLRPYAGTAGTVVPMDNAVNVVNADLQIQVDNATLSDAGGALNNHVVLGSAARPLTLGSATNARTLNVSPVAREHDLTIDTVQLNNNGTINVDVDNEVTGDAAAPAANRNVITIRTILQDATARNLTKTGPDTLIVNQSAHAGTTTVSGGTLQLGSVATPAGAFATSGVTLSGGGGLRYMAAPTATTGVEFAKVTNNGGRIEISYANAALASLTAAQLSDAGDTLRLSADQSTAAGATLPGAAVNRLELNSDVGTGYNGVQVAAGGTVASVNGARTYASNLTLLGNATVDTGGGNLTLSGAVSTTGTLTKNGANTLVLAQAAPFTGTTAVNAGVLEARGTGAALGNTPATVAGASTLRFNPGAGNTATAGPVNITSGTLHAQSGVTDLGAGTINGSIPVYVAGLREGRVSGSFNETAANPNAAIVLGPTKIQPGFGSSGGSGGVWVDNSTYVYNGQILIPDNETAGDGQGAVSFGESFDDSVLVKVDGAQVLRNTGWNDTSSNGRLQLSAGWHDIELRFGQGGGGVGAVNQDNWGTATFGFGIDLTDPVNALAVSGGTAPPANFNQLFTAPVDNGSMNLFRTLSGGVSTVQVDAGADLRAAGVTAANLQLAGGAAGSPSVMRLTAPGNSSVLNLSLSAPAGMTSPGGTLELAAGHTLTASAVSVATGSTLTKTGPGTLLVTSGEGTGAGAVVVAAGTLGGSGSIAGSVTVAGGAAVSPGTSPGILGTGNLTLQPGADAVFELLGTTPGTGHDQLNVTGTVDLTGADLVVASIGAIGVGDQFTIIRNDGADLVAGVFANGATVTGPNGSAFAINYAGGDGNDVVLTTTAVPEPATAGVLAAAGLGLLARRRRRR